MGKLCCKPVTLSDQALRKRIHMWVHEYRTKLSIHSSPFLHSILPEKSKSDVELQTKNPSQVEVLWSHVTPETLLILLQEWGHFSCLLHSYKHCLETSKVISVIILCAEQTQSWYETAQGGMCTAPECFINPSACGTTGDCKSRILLKHLCIPHGEILSTDVKVQVGRECKKN